MDDIKAAIAAHVQRVVRETMTHQRAGALDGLEVEVQPVTNLVTQVRVKNDGSYGSGAPRYFTVKVSEML